MVFVFVLVLVLGFVGCFGAGAFGLLPPSICSVSFPSTMTWAKAYRLVLEEHGTCYSVLALLLAFVSPSDKRKGEESPSEKLRRLSSPRHWDVALVPFPEDFAPLPTPTQTGLARPAMGLPT